MEYIIESDPVRVIREQIHLLTDHKDEVCVFPDVILDPDWDKYDALDKLEMLAVITARRNGKVVGYSVNILMRHLHYDFKYAINDIIYMIPPLRGHAMGLLRATERMLTDIEVKFFSLSVKPHIDYRPVLERLGYKLLEYQYFRRL